MRPREVVAIALALAIAVCAGDRARNGSTLHAQVRTTPGTVVPVPAPSVSLAVCPAPSRLMQWPSSTNPVWEFCFNAPSVSSGPNGSGLEIYNVYYNGHLVFKRAHVPILNVLYAPGGCGCFRDWAYSEVSFQADNVITGGLGGYAEPTSPPQTVCDTGGTHGDVGTFTGVAAEKLSDRLILTTQFLAGWYRYTMKWRFFLDGRIEPWFGFAARNTSSCVQYNHTHHVYWRFDFDIDGAIKDQVLEEPKRDHGGTLPTGTLLASELLRRTNNPGGSWVIRDAARNSTRGYRVIPGPEADLVADSFAVGDAWFLKYKPTEIDDSGQSGPSCAIKFNNYLNNEDINGTDVVMWYRGGVFHEGADLDDCHKIGPTLVPVGDWSRTPPPLAAAK